MVPSIGISITFFLFFLISYFFPPAVTRHDVILASGVYSFTSFTGDGSGRTKFSHGVLSDDFGDHVNSKRVGSVSPSTRYYSEPVLFVAWNVASEDAAIFTV